MTTKVTSEILIDMPRAQAWEKLRDLSLPHNYVPGVRDTKITTEIREGVGASRKVFMKSDTVGMDETVIEWTDGEGFLIRLHKGDKPAMALFSEMYFRYALEDAGEHTRFKASLICATRFGLFGRILDILVLRSAFRKNLDNICLAIKEFYETGNPVGPQRLKELQRA